MTSRKFLVAVLIAFCGTWANAEIEKFARPGSKGLDLVWWPRLPILAGWHHDREASWQVGANVLVPEGESFSDAPAILYGNAVFKPRTEAKTLAEFIKNDQTDFKQNVPGVKISAIAPLPDGDKQQLATYQFTPTSKGDWEIIAYGEEDDFFLVFALNAHSEAAMRATLPAFKMMIRRYHR